MIDLRAGLGAPPLVFPAIQMKHPDAPAARPGNAPIMPKNARAQASLGCCQAGVSPMGGRGIGDVAPATAKTWYQSLALPWKIGLVVGAVGALFGIGYGVYRVVR